MTQSEIGFNKIDKWLCGLVAFCIIFGGVLNSGSFRIAGMVITLYRFSIPLFTIIFLTRRWKKKEWRILSFSKSFMLYALMMIFWIIYGGFLLMTSPYAPLHDGLKELIDLSLGLLSIYCIYECCDTRDKIHFFMNILKIFAVIFVCIAILEMFTGVHLPTSEYGKYQTFKNLDYIFLIGISSKQLFPITTTFYGINDFSVLISVLFPLFYIEKEQKRSEKIWNGITMFTIVLILTFSDANICIMGIIAATLFRVIFRAKRRNAIISLGFIILVQQCISGLVGKLILLIKTGIHQLHLVDMNSNALKETFIKMSKDASKKTTTLTEVMSSQVHNANDGAGSLWYRMMLALDSLEMWVKSHLLGVGPSGFSAYLKKNGSRTYLTNPHNWWLEILSQYGILVFLAYFASMIYVFFKNFMDYLKYRDEKQLQFLCMCVIFVIGCMAPSSFLGYSYQWILPALGIAFISIKSNS